MFVDASTIVAILCGEPDGPDFAGRLNGSKTGFYVSPLVLFEATMALAEKLARETGLPHDAALIVRAQEAVQEFTTALGAREISISADIGRKAVETAQARAGSADASLDLGTCFSQACAQAYRVPLLTRLCGGGVDAG